MGITIHHCCVLVLLTQGRMFFATTIRMSTHAQRLATTSEACCGDIQAHFSTFVELFQHWVTSRPGLHFSAAPLELRLGQAVGAAQTLDVSQPLSLRIASVLAVVSAGVQAVSCKWTDGERRVMLALASPHL